MKVTTIGLHCIESEVGIGGMALTAFLDIVVDVIAPSLHLVQSQPDGSGCGEVQRSPRHCLQRPYSNELVVKGRVPRSIDGEDVTKNGILGSLEDSKTNPLWTCTD